MVHISNQGPLIAVTLRNNLFLSWPEMLQPVQPPAQMSHQQKALHSNRRTAKRLQHILLPLLAKQGNRGQTCVSNRFFKQWKIDGGQQPVLTYAGWGSEKYDGKDAPLSNCWLLKDIKDVPRNHFVITGQGEPEPSWGLGTWCPL